MSLFSKIAGAITGMPIGGSGHAQGPDPSWVQEGLSMAQPGATAQGSGYIPGGSGGGGMVSQIHNALNQPTGSVQPQAAEAAKAPPSSLDAIARSRGFQNYEQMMAFTRQKYGDGHDANTAGAGAPPQQQAPPPQQAQPQSFVQSLVNPFVQLTHMFSRANGQ